MPLLSLSLALSLIPLIPYWAAKQLMNDYGVQAVNKQLTVLTFEHALVRTHTHTQKFALTSAYMLLLMLLLLVLFANVS